MKSLTNYIDKYNEYCWDVGMKPEEVPTPGVTLSPSSLVEKQEAYEDLLSVVNYFSLKLVNLLSDVPILITVSDNKGFILNLVGDELIKKTIIDLKITPGIQFEVQTMGTNVVNLSLDHPEGPVQIIGNEHYHHYLHGAACYGVAIKNIETNEVLGSISIMTFIDYKNSLISTMLETIVDSIERELMLRKQNTRLNVLHQVMMDNNQYGVLTTDKYGKITEFNMRAEILTGEKIKNVLGKDISALDSIGQYVLQVLHDDKRYKDVYITIVPNDKATNLIFLFDAFPIYDEKSNIIGAYAQFRDITEQAEAQEQLNFLANHDEQTGLPNRRHLQKKLTELTDEKIYEHKDGQFALIHLDLDRFKIVNGTLGHTNGDLLLKRISNRLEGSLDSDEFIARVGGDEFILIIPITEEKDIHSIKQKLENVFATPLWSKGYEFHITASMGFVIFPDDTLNPEELLLKADTALFQAKSLGKNHIVMYSTELDTNSHEKIIFESSLRKAFDLNEFELYYQPQIEIETGIIKGVEALIRWRHPERGIVSPDEFIPIVEETGLINKLDEWVLRTACEQNMKWQNMGLPPIRVAVNLSSNQFENKGLIELVRTVLHETGLKAEYLELEITESMTMNVEYAIPTLKGLSNLGVLISVDDFGTGYSSMSYLTKFSIDRLKIDRSFIWNIEESKSDTNIVSTIIQMAYGLGLEVIAEGVENEKQLQFLLEHGCDEVQGFYFSKPVPAGEIEERILSIEKLKCMKL